MIWLHVGAGSIKDLTCDIAEGLRIIERNVKGTEDIYITHIRGGQHIAGSFHPHGRAFDMRKLSILYPVSIVREWLGKDFDVIDHSTHWHIEYDPKG